MNAPLKVYLAGPGVFLQDSEEYGLAKCAICRRHGFAAHYPTDNHLPLPTLIESLGPRGTALEISRHDEQGMDGCQVIVADLSPCLSGLPDLRVLVKGDAWDEGTLLGQRPGLRRAFDRYPGLAELVIEFPEAGQLLTGQPDTGTVFELGYMVARSKHATGGASPGAFAYSNSPLDYYTRLLIANGGELPPRVRGVAAHAVEEDVNHLMVDRLDPTMHGNLMIDSPVIRTSGRGVHRPSVEETRRFLTEGRRQGRRDGMYRYLGVFERAVEHAAEVLKAGRGPGPAGG